MLIKLTLVSILAILPALALAGETQKPTKAERIRYLTVWIAEREPSIPIRARDIANLKTNGDPKGWLPQMEINQKATMEGVAQKKIELAWLKGELTKTKAEAAVKAAQESFDKAKDADKPAAQDALNKAKAELAAVEKFEAARDF
jgi:hypothetical protein